MTRRLIGTLMLAGLTALTGCVNLAPDYHRPNAVTPDIWPLINGQAEPAASSSTRSAAALGWREFFLDPRLRRTVALALARNQNLRVAALNIEQAREQYRQTGAALFPSINASGSLTESKSGGQAYGGSDSTSSRVVTGSDVSKSESVELGFASYQLDFFGELRNEKQAALEALRASSATRRSTQISLIAEVASDWLSLSADKELLILARRTLANQQDNLRLVQARHRYGIASGSDVADAQSAVDSARVDVATYTTSIAQDRDALNLVVGATVPVADLPGDRVPANPVVAQLPAGVPSSVLTNRPDVLAAEYTLRGDYASIGAARAAFFPTISLTASTGFATQGLSNLFSHDNRTWSFSPQASLPIFDGGANRAALAITETQQKIDVANYEQAIQTAFSEVADALATRATIDEQVAAQTALVAADRRAYRLALARYKAGSASYLDTLTEQRTLYSARQEAVNRRLARQTNLVNLYEALGGGGFALSTDTVSHPSSSAF